MSSCEDHFFLIHKSLTSKAELNVFVCKCMLMSCLEGNWASDLMAPRVNH